MRTRDKITVYVAAGAAVFIAMLLPIMAWQMHEVDQALDDNNVLLAQLNHRECPATAEDMVKIVKGSTPEMWSRPPIDKKSNVRWWSMTTKGSDGQYRPVEVTVEGGLVSSLGGSTLYIDDMVNDPWTTPGGFAWACVTYDLY